MPSLLHRYLPSSFKDPIGLAGRLLRSKEPAAYFAMAATALSVLTTPLDLLLGFAERRVYARAAEPRRPIVLVTGAPRSGTTVLAQTLIHNLPVSFVNNLTMLFPRAPIVANRLFGPLLPTPPIGYRSFYGRTSGFASPNDGLHLWDRWLGRDRYRVPKTLSAKTAHAMRAFFGAWEETFDQPLINKNNALATCAPLIARALPTAHILHIRREPAFNVQSIIGAREKIQGSREIGYGVEDPQWVPGRESYVTDVCAQVLYHERKMEAQRREIPPDRYWIVSYEEFCREPFRIVERVAREILDVRVDADALRARLLPLKNTNRPSAQLDEIEETLARLSSSTRAGAASAS